MKDYERHRQENIEKNKAILIELGLDVIAASMPTIVPKPQQSKGAAKSKKAPVVKRKREEEEYDDDEENVQVETKAPRINIDGARRSSRLARQEIDYNEDALEKSNRVRAEKAKKRELQEDTMGRLNSKVGERTENPKQFGHIPGVPVGTCWEFRTQCSKDAVHAPVVAGISGNAIDGAYSVALSGGYDDDVDLGYVFTYTGAGGRDLKGTKDAPKNLRTGPQVKDQSFDHPPNRALQLSCETRKPVRVIRGYKLPSIYAPESGYRYDGLYVVERAWMEPGLNENGYKVVKYAFKRLPDQPPIPERHLDEDGQDAGEDETEAVDDATSNRTSPPSSAADEEGVEDESEPELETK
ncbi:hypothetical protein FRC18_006313 [Serendipita sp. 400]|nr:hypothetical protein FRC18_006313 [Serendipita sp. 400]